MKRRRIASLLLALVAFLGLTISAPAPAAADGPIGTGVDFICTTTTGPLGPLMKIAGKVNKNLDMCAKVGKVAQKTVNKAWKAVQDSLLGDAINSLADFARTVIKKTLTVALLGPSLDLRATGLWSGDATLAGMLTWLGLVIATFGLMWQLGKMALTGQLKYAGQAASGWVQNILISALGVGVVALLLGAGDAMTTGLVNATFNDDGAALDRIVAVLLPTLANPMTLLCIVAILLLVGAIQLIMVFLRQSAIPIQCLLLPVAGAGRAGGETTRQWAPKLITSICMVICYKPMLAIIICTGFAEFGHSKTLVEWLRGCATLVLAVLAPGPLMKIFAPLGEAMGGGMAGGGAMGALGGAAAYLGGKFSGGDGQDPDPSGGGPTTAVEHARMVSQTMGEQGNDSHGGDGGQGQDAQAQAARNDATANTAPEVPNQGGPGGTSGAAEQGAGTAGGAAAGAGGAAAGVGIAIQVIDGINQGVQDAAGEIGNGGTKP